jgi:pimeloyl-ACP methyl ester carboxylesterase
MSASERSGAGGRRSAYDAPTVKLRLYHHRDGARVAYREAGTGPPLALLHSAWLSHREFEPLVEHLTDRFRVVLPDLPLHGDSEDRPRHPYTLPWFAEVMAGFATEVLGPHPLIGGHGSGAEILLEAVATGRLAPRRLVLMPNRMHGRCVRPARARAGRMLGAAGRIPGLDLLLSHAAKRAVRPDRGLRLSARENPAARDLVRHAFADVGGNSNLARSWARCARAWPAGARRQLLDVYPRLEFPVLLLWADRDRLHPLSLAEEALDRLPEGQLRVLSGTGFLLAYDDPIGVARELAAFCG